MNKEQFEKELDMKLASLKEEMMQKFAEEQKKLEDEFPKIGGVYWFVTSNGEIHKAVWTNSEIDKGLLKIGNVFKTQEEAEFESERLKVIAELKKYAEPKGQKWNMHISHYYILYVCRENDIGYYSDSTLKHADIYFETKERAREAVKKVGVERVKKYYLRVEE